MYVIGEKDFGHEIEGLKSIVERINKIKNEAVSINKKSAEVLEVKEFPESEGRFYNSPLYDLENKVEDIAGQALEDLAEKAFNRWAELIVPNAGASLNKLLSDITIKYDEHFLYGDTCKRERDMSSYDLRERLDLGWLFDKFKLKYADNAKTVSEEHILYLAKQFLPHQFSNEPKIQAKDILFGNVLRFQNVYSYSRHSKYRQEIDALNKLARVILQSADIITVDDSVQPFGEKHFKNGRFDVIFNSEADAQKVAEVLINGFPKEVESKNITDNAMGYGFPK